MKYLFLIGLLTASVCSTTGQDLPINQKPVSKALLFPHLPSKTAINSSELMKVIHVKKADEVSIVVSAELTLTGQVIEKIETKELLSVNILVSNYENALLNLSIITDSDNKKKFSGRLVHPKRGDALTISEENGKYYLNKQALQHFMVE